MKNLNIQIQNKLNLHDIHRSSQNLEKNVREEYINRLVNHYNFKIEQIDQCVEVKNSIIGKGNAYADIVVWRSVEDKESNKTPLIVVECKAEQVTIREEDYYKGAQFAESIKARFFVTTNLKETRIFSKVYKVGKKGQKYNLEEINDIPKASEATNEKELINLLEQTKKFSREKFSTLLFKCHNIIRNNDKLSPEAAFDEISKILFIKSSYERKNKEGQIFSLEDYEKGKRIYLNINSNSNNLPYYKYLFEEVKRELRNDDLFEPNETIKIRENSFEDIIDQLQRYNLSTTSEDIKGLAFEQFLGRTFRGELGQFFTPRTIVDYMVDILDPQEGEKICDPCCGSGGFLIRAFEYVKDKIEKDILLAKDTIKDKYFSNRFYSLGENEQKEIESVVNKQLNLLNAEFDLNNQYGRLRKLSHECIYGTDANPRMARTAKMNMIMHGDGHGGVHHHDGLINVNGIYDNRFDIILTNPPFGSRVDKSIMITTIDVPSDEKCNRYCNIYGQEYKENVINPLKEWAQYDNGKNKPKGKSILSLFDTGVMSSLTEVLFIERCLNLLKPGGRMGIVLPEGVLNNNNLQKVREYVESKAKIINITSIPQDVFIASGATVKPSLLFFKKFTEKEAKKYNKIKVKVSKTVQEKYKVELEELRTQLKVHRLAKEGKQDLKSKQKQILQQIEDEIKNELKIKFDYEIPIVEVEKAGISSTGAPIDNELLPIAKEFKKYRLKKKLWNEFSENIIYYDFNNIFQRVIGVGEPHVFYGNTSSKKYRHADYK
jgi:type I restriction enzyme M protein